MDIVSELVAARHDFAVLRHQLHGKRFELREAVLVVKDGDGRPAVIEISARHVRSGAGWGAGIGLLVGLLIPPLAVSVAVRRCRRVGRGVRRSQPQERTPTRGRRGARREYRCGACHGEASHPRFHDTAPAACIQKASGSSMIARYMSRYPLITNRSPYISSAMDPTRGL